MEEAPTPGRTGPPAGDAGGGGQPGVDVPEPGSRKRGPHPDAGKYVVLAAEPVHPEPADETKPPPVPGEFKPVGEPIAAEGQREAKKAAIEQHEWLAERVNGGGVFLVAVPAMSWQPTLVVAEQPPPIMRGL